MKRLKDNNKTLLRCRSSAGIFPVEGGGIRNGSSYMLTLTCIFSSSSADFDSVAAAAAATARNYVVGVADGGADQDRIDSSRVPKTALAHYSDEGCAVPIPRCRLLIRGSRKRVPLSRDFVIGPTAADRSHRVFASVDYSSRDDDNVDDPPPRDEDAAWGVGEAPL